MANRHRGEIEAVFDGKARTLCLTLGALASLESHFGVDNLPALAAHIGKGDLRSSDLIAILHAGLKGGGHDFSAEEVGEMRVEGSAGGFATIVSQLLEASFAVPQNMTDPQKMTE